MLSTVLNSAIRQRPVTAVWGVTASTETSGVAAAADDDER